MVNKKQKGDKAEKEVVQMLEKRGYVVMRSPRTMRMIGKGRFISQSNDYFNLYDICAKKSSPKKVISTRWIQVVSTSSHASEMRKKIQEFHLAYNNPYETSEVWQRVSRLGFAIYLYARGQWTRTYVNLQGYGCEPFIINKKETKK